MPRRREVPKREVPPDPLYNSTLVTKFVRTIMKSGKRSTAEGLLYGSLDIIRERTGDDPLKVFKKAVDNVKPSLEVKSRRVGGSNYQVPIEVNPNRHFLRPNLRLEGVWGSRYEHFIRAVSVMESGDVDFAAVISHELPLERVREGFDALNGNYELDGKTAFKIAVRGAFAAGVG